MRTATYVVTAVLIAAPPASAEPVPTADEVVADLNRVFDPAVPCADKTDVVTPGFSSDECGKIDEFLNRLSARGLLPFTFVVTDIQPAPDNFAGATVSVPRPYTPPGPVVLAGQNEDWLLTHDTVMAALKAIWANVYGGDGGTGGSNSMPPQPNVTNP